VSVKVSTSDDRASRPTAVLWDKRFTTHDMGRAALYLPITGLVEDDLHVDNPARIVRLRHLITSSGLEQAVLMRGVRAATHEQLTRVHSLDHVERMASVSATGAGDAGGGYTPMDHESYELALLSAGSALTALEVVLSAEAANAYAMLRRSGHHASRDTGFGFCIFNNCAVAARAAQAEHGLARVAIVDIDVHHGNGTEAIFYDDPTVLTVSIHQDRGFPADTGLFEHRGEGAGYGFNLNVPLSAGTGDAGYLLALDRIVAPTLRAFTPDLIVVACGLDANVYDPMARLALTASGFAAVAERLLAWADELCASRLVLIQEGGYSHVYAPFCGLAMLETIARVPERHSDPFEPFLAGCGFAELTVWQREVIEQFAAELEAGDRTNAATIAN
jgi:acetoin utilization deacetylase AcuC-like enzyme